MPVLLEATRHGTPVWLRASFAWGPRDTIDPSEALPFDDHAQGDAYRQRELPVAFRKDYQTVDLATALQTAAAAEKGP